VAALYTAVVYNQPLCVQLMLGYLGRMDPSRHSFFKIEGPSTEMLNASDLANTLGNAVNLDVIFLDFQNHFIRFHINHVQNYSKR
jgi:hypothetical protein